WHQRAAGGGLRMKIAATALAWLAFAVLFTPGPLLAQDAPVIYRCTGADGAVTIQNDTPCPAGSKQEIPRIQPLPSTPPPAATQTAPAEAVFVPPPLADFVQVAGPQEEAIIAPDRPALPDARRIADAARLPPPPIFRC